MATSSWTLIGGLKPTAPPPPAPTGTGTAGTPGTQILTGTVAPIASQGIDNDLFLNTTNSTMYKKTAGAWAVLVNLKGASGTNGTNGAAGTNGTAGANGVNGATWYTGTADPVVGLGVINDLYLNTSSQAIFKKTGTATWSMIGSLVSASPPAPPPSGDILNGDGVTVNTALYQAMANVLGSDTGKAYLYGPDSSSYGVGTFGTTLHEPTHNTTRGGDTYWEIPEGGSREPGDATNDQPGAGSYSTSQATVLFTPDVRATWPGIAGNVQTFGHEYNTAEVSPQLSWTTGGPSQGFTDPGCKQTANLALINTGGSVALPMCTGGGHGRNDNNRGRANLFDSGLLVTTGSNTNQNFCSASLPAGLIPTAVCITNVNEFALVTCWDKVNVKGYLAVFALAGIPEGASVNASTGALTGFYDNWGEWMRCYPGLPNWGDFGYAKFLGVLDLGTDMVAPTGVSATNGMDQFNQPFHYRYDNTPITTFFANFQTGGSRNGTLAKGGIAVVISKSEQRVKFIDLQPLFAFYLASYFTNSAAAAATNTVGPAANQWPYTFSNSPSQTPTIISSKTETLTDRPTAVQCNAYSGSPAVWIATQTGTCRMYKMGRYAPGNDASLAAARVTSDIAFVSSITVGRNVTSMAYSRNEQTAGVADDMQVVLCSRGDRKVQWVRKDTGTTTQSVVRTLQDSRLVDPIAIDDNENYATDSYIISVADYAGRALRNYRYGPIIFAEAGGNAPSGAAWGCQSPTACATVSSGGIDSCGSMSLPGKPFMVSSANVP